MTTNQDTRDQQLEAAVVATRGDVDRQRQVLAEWEAKEAAATAELESMQQRAGADILDNPDAETSIARSMAELRDRIDLAQRAVVAQRPRLLLAERRYLAAEADALEPAIAELELQLAEHEKKTNRLLSQLEAHEGGFVPEVAHIALQRSAGFDNAPMSWTLPKSAVMHRELTSLRRPLEVLRAMADGEDPAALIASWGVSASEVYPPCVYGPDAVVPAGAYVRSVERARALVAELEQLERHLPAEIRDWEQQQAEGRPGEQLLALDFRKARLADVPEELAQARAALAELTSTGG